MTDWHGVRRRNTDGLITDNPPPLPPRRTYVIPARTNCLVKRTGDRHWTHHVTKEAAEFDSLHGENTKTYTFFRTGWLLNVQRHLVETRTETARARW